MDSSAWLEYFAGGANADRFAPAILATRELLVPTLALYEVFKRVRVQRGDSEALQAVAFMEQGQVIDFDRALALAAARISLAHDLPMADSIMLATARQFGATLWTQDADFEAIEGVKYFAKPASRN